MLFQTCTKLNVLGRRLSTPEYATYLCPYQVPIVVVELRNAFLDSGDNFSSWYFARSKQRQFGTRLKEHQKAVFFCKKENSALSEHTCLINHTIGWDKSKTITTNRRYHQRLCLEAWHINFANAPLNRDDGGLLPGAYLHFVRKKGSQLVSV